MSLDLGRPAAAIPCVGLKSDSLELTNSPPPDGTRVDSLGRPFNPTTGSSLNAIVAFVILQD